MRLLLVEDEPKMARMLAQGLREENYHVDTCTRADDAERQASAVGYDGIILDWSLPDGDGVSLLRRWRDQGLRTPVLMLTARGSTGERVTGLKAGADDYLVKPFDFEEFLARVEALLRRGGNSSTRTQLGSATLDAARRLLRGPAAEIELTTREYALVHVFFSHVGEVLSRGALLRAAWGDDFDHTQNVVDVYVGYLRTKLANAGITDCEIVSVRGVGYRFTRRETNP